MHQIRPRSRWGNSQRAPRSPNCNLRVLLLREGKSGKLGREEEEEVRGKEKREREKEEGKGKKVNAEKERQAPKFTFLATRWLIERYNTPYRFQHGLQCLVRLKQVKMF